MIRECNRALRLALTGGTPIRAAKVALVVGTLLVVINQWEALLGMEPISIPKLLLTYLVPYLVSTHTSVSKDLSHSPGGECEPERQSPQR